MPILPDASAHQEGLLKRAATGVSMAQTYERNVAQIEPAGGLPQINHPNLAWSVQLNDLLPLSRPFLHGDLECVPDVQQSGRPRQRRKDSASTEALWDALLSRGKVVWGVASDDAHEYHTFDDRESPTPGKGWIVLQATSLTVPAVMEAMRSGRFYASTGISLESYSTDRDGHFHEDRSRPVNGVPRWRPARDIRPVSSVRTGRCSPRRPATSPQYRFTGEEQYVRASIVDSDGRRAWTQPVFVSSVRRNRPEDTR